jgi:hypothetical protein
MNGIFHNLSDMTLSMKLHYGYSHPQKPRLQCQIGIWKPCNTPSITIAVICATKLLQRLTTASIYHNDLQGMVRSNFPQSLDILL